MPPRTRGADKKKREQGIPPSPQQQLNESKKPRKLQQRRRRAEAQPEDAHSGQTESSNDVVDAPRKTSPISFASAVLSPSGQLDSSYGAGHAIPERLSPLSSKLFSSPPAPRSKFEPVQYVDPNARDPVIGYYPSMDGKHRFKVRKRTRVMASSSPAPREDGTVHLLATKGGHRRSLSLRMTTDQVGKLFDMLAKKYEVIEEAPKLTLVSGTKRTATTEPDDPQPTKKIRLSNGAQGRLANGAEQVLSKALVPLQVSDDDSDLDIELDTASSSFKENVPVGQHHRPRSSRAPLSDHQEACANDRHFEDEQNTQGALAVQIPETPRTRWTLGNIVNSVGKFIPRLGRAPQIAALPAASSNDVPVTPPASLNQRPLPQTAPHHTAQTETLERSSPTLRPQAASVRIPHIKSKPRTQADQERMNLQRRADKMQRRKEFRDMETEEKHRALDEQEQEIQRKRIELQEEEELKARMADQEEATSSTQLSGQAPPSKYIFRTGRAKSQRKAAESTSVFGPRQEPYSTGARIAEAQAAKNRERGKRSPEHIPGPSRGGFGMNEDFFSIDSDEDDEPTSSATATTTPAKTTTFPIGDPHKAQPALGSYFQTPTGPKLHGGNIFRDADAEEEVAARALAIQESSIKQPPRTPKGEVITNLSGHFAVPDDSDSSDEETSEAISTTPASRRSVKDSLSEMAIFRGDNISRSDASAQRSKPVPPDPNARLGKDSIWRQIPLPGRTEILPPLPPTPSPAHAQLPDQSPSKKGDEPASSPNKPQYGILKGGRFAKPAPPAPAAPPAEDSEGLKAARAKALKHAPRQPSSLRESHPISSPSQASEPTANEPNLASETRVRSPSPESSDETMVPQSSAPPTQDSTTLVEDENNSSLLPPSDPDEYILYHGEWLKRKVVEHIEGNWTEEDGKWSTEWVANDFAKFLAEEYVPDPRMYPKFSPKVEDFLSSPEVQAMIKSDSSHIAGDMKKSIERGFAI